ncbi:MAG: superfamily I DNA and RNA helicase and helicaseubunit [Thermoplasmata archaeon]|nr:MAG: superfamily I DNA and RNA helicase and helicaseubunit [Thermoplasmata archaeon]
MSPDARVEELRKRFREAVEHLGKGDPVQAAEKLYKVAENAVKILSEINRIPECEKARQEGTWWTKLLDRAAKRLRDTYGEELLNAWTTAYKFHQKGFHEEQLTVEDIMEEIYKIEDLLKIVEKEAKKSMQS